MAVFRHASQGVTVRNFWLCMTFQPATGFNVANFEPKRLPLFMLQTLTNALLKTSVTRMPHAATPKDLTTALAKMDLKATAETARVRFCLRT